MEGGRVIVAVGGHDAGAILAVDPATGGTQWSWKNDGPAYASPVAATLDGVRQVVAQTRASCVGLDARTGTLLWSVPLRTPYDQNAVTPVICGQSVLVGGTSRPTQAVRPRRQQGGWQVDTIWETREATLYMSTPVFDGRRIFGFSERSGGRFFAMAPEDGRVLWAGEGREGENATLVDAGDAVLAFVSSGELVVFRKTPAGLSRAGSPRRLADPPLWASPAIVPPHVVVKERSALTCWKLPGA
jgi:outer membrane protein assembly factor BamB